ncbi:MAG: hypothetical protein RBT79_10900, partial [Chiayiivirga sp.]|nr:hypothetical protein [Chiayiivirga sp.]
MNRVAWSTLCKGDQLPGQAAPALVGDRAQGVKYAFAREAVELDMAAGRQAGETLLHFLLQLPAG